jgi:hypothetical protein
VDAGEARVGRFQVQQRYGAKAIKSQHEEQDQAGEASHTAALLAGGFGRWEVGWGSISTELAGTYYPHPFRSGLRNCCNSALQRNNGAQGRLLPFSALSR